MLKLGRSGGVEERIFTIDKYFERFEWKKTSNDKVSDYIELTDIVNTKKIPNSKNF